MWGRLGVQGLSAPGVSRKGVTHLEVTPEGCAVVLTVILALAFAPGKGARLG